MQLRPSSPPRPPPRLDLLREPPPPPLRPWEPAVATPAAANARSVVEAAVATALSAGEAFAADADPGRRRVPSRESPLPPEPTGEVSVRCRHPGRRQGRLAHRRIREAVTDDAVCGEKEGTR
ncbi:hypothetical protein OsI_35795 [Oryza sativa Indica Group]|uniref:Uncharacterized protein n=1 Tax=Oryza sativa subsp. indica TaxID=39946 RepID=B8BK20_ORYSI|nr:hypothetical protein OsI_35795 [Oryza sativa Indica Group]